MSKKPKSPAPPAKSKSFFYSKEKQREMLEARRKSEAALVASLDAIFDKIEQEEAKAIARAQAHAKAQNLSPEETEALIKQALEEQLQRDRTSSTRAWIKRRKLTPVHNGGEFRSELRRLLGIGKRD